MNAPILAVDPGEKRLGLAISDPGGVIANPLGVIPHVKREIDAARVAAIALERQAAAIIVGQALDSEGQPGFQARRARRFAAALRAQTHLPVILWDESGSTQTARQARVQMGVRRRQQGGHLDDLAAVVILQSYLDAHNPAPSSEEIP